MSDKRFALLIDSDNISAKYIDSILDEMTRHGVSARCVGSPRRPSRPFSPTCGRRGTPSRSCVRRPVAAVPLDSARSGLSMPRRRQG